MCFASTLLRLTLFLVLINIHCIFVVHKGSTSHYINTEKAILLGHHVSSWLIQVRQEWQISDKANQLCDFAAFNPVSYTPNL